MKAKKSIVVLFILSVMLAVVGSLIDTDVSESSFLTTIFEVFMLTIIISILLSTIYFPIKFLLKRFNKNP